MLLFTVLALFTSKVNAQRLIDIISHCPSTVQPMIANSTVTAPAIPPDGAITVTMPETFKGYIYLASNGGQSGGQGATKAYFDLPNDVYYIVVDSTFNAGLAISPEYKQGESYCQVDQCNAPGCSNVYYIPPTSYPTIPPGSGPVPPFYSCAGAHCNYALTFCPLGIFPPAGVALHPNGDNSKCVDVKGNVHSNGTPVDIYDCNGTGAQKWVLNKGDTKLQLAQTNYCLDAGSPPASGVKAKIWQCYDGLPAQAWYLTDDNRIAVTGEGQCLDLTDGSTANGNTLQTWKCTTGNTNQIWTGV